MTAFRYEALDTRGQKSVGVLEADSSRSARALLRERGLSPLEVSSVSGGHSHRPGRGRLRESELALLSRQWATLLSAGLTVERALAALIEQTEEEPARQTLAGVRSEVLSGYSLRAALDRYPGAFPSIYRASVAAGERSGALPNVMTQLADYLERRQILHQKTLQALLYPMIVAAVAFLVVIGLMTYVVPQVVVVFQQGKQELPILTRGLIAASDFLRQWGAVLLIGIGSGGIGTHYLLRDKHIRRQWDRWLLTLPVFGRHLRTLDATRFASTMAILAGSGVPLLSAMEASVQVISRVPLQDAVRDASEKVREGQSLSRALASTSAFPPLLIHMIASGESTGQLDALLERASRLQQQELEARTTTLTTMLEPLLLLTMGGLVLLIVLAVMQPIIEINTLLR